MGLGCFQRACLVMEMMSQVNYTDDLLDNLSDEGLDQELYDLLYDDIQFLSDLGVSNNKQRNLAFYLDLFCDDLLNEFDCKADRKLVIIRAFGFLKDIDDIDLTKIRSAVFKALLDEFPKKKKLAYPNIISLTEINAKPERDVSKWVQTLYDIYRNSKNIDEVVKEWDPMEQYDFKAWMKYYQGRNHEKYNVKTASQPSWLSNFEGDEVEQPIKKEIKKDKTSEEIKKSLLGRLNSAEKLLYNFVHVWPSDVYMRLHQGLSDLKREIMMMRTASSMRDIIVRTATVWDQIGFNEGANELRKIAQPPGGDITSEIEKALTGREFEKPEVPAEPPEIGAEMGAPMGPPEEPPLPEEGVPGPPEGVEEPLPPMEEPPVSEEPPIEEVSKKDSEKNPYMDATVQDVLEILEPLSQKLREREFIHSLSKADMMLDALNIASHFPEIAEAQAKALELNLYVGLRIEKIISKLKGGLKEEEEKKEQPPSIEMEELSEGVEETAFEVAEEMPPAGAPPTEEKPVPPIAPLER